MNRGSEFTFYEIIKEGGPQKKINGLMGMVSLYFRAIK